MTAPTDPLSLGLGLSALIACAGCSDRWPSATREADLPCYWSAEASAQEPSVRAALADGKLTEKECHEVVIPLVEAANARSLIAARERAIRAARESAR